MPAYLRQIRIDWSYDLASSSLQNALREANQRLSSRDHTPLTFDEQLRRFASEHTDARATALIEEDERTYLLFRVQNGTVTRVDVERSADGSFVTEPDLIARLLHGDFAPVPEPPAHPDDKKGQALYFPEPMLDEIRFQAARLDRSLSWVVQSAWTLARAVIQAAPEQDPSEDSEASGGACKRKQTLFFPAAMLDEIKHEALRIDSSLSFVVQSVWRSAHPQIAALKP